MARNTEAVCRQCRRIGDKLFLKGDRCYSSKCGVERRRRPPGDQGTRRPRRPTDWALQLREKQKARFTYGVLERQFKNYFADARESQGVTGDVLLQLLERRLDNVVYRLSFVDSRPQARQIVNHGHFNVNGRKVSIPSYRVRPGDIITWRRVTDDATPGFVEALTDGIPKRPVPTWLKLEPGTLTGEVLTLPEPSEIDTGIDARLIVEFYSR
jgi:small subunit ribosomal protein S4